MTSSELMDRAFHAITTVMVQTGRAPSHVELVDRLGHDTGKTPVVLNDLMATGCPGWLEENYAFVTICPFSNRPNQYKISVDGEQKWFGQRGIESLAVCRLFPGRLVRIENLCPDRDEPSVVEMRDGDVELCVPEGAVVHDNVPSDKPWPDR